MNSQFKKINKKTAENKNDLVKVKIRNINMLHQNRKMLIA